MDKWIGGFLQVGAGALFVLAGNWEAIPLLLPATASGIAGLMLWGRRPKEVPKEPTDRALDARLARIEEVLGGVQADTVRLRESRDFMDELYAGKQGQSRELPRGES